MYINGMLVLEHDDALLDPIQDSRKPIRERQRRNGRVRGFLVWMFGMGYFFAWVISLF